MFFQLHKTAGMFHQDLEYSYCIRAIGSERALFFIDARLKIIKHSCPGCCPAGSVFARLSMKLTVDCQFTQSDFKNKLRVLYFIHDNSLLIYWEFTTSA